MGASMQHPQGEAMLADTCPVCPRGGVEEPRYDTSLPGSFRLVPPMSRTADLARDYAQMRPMFLAPAERALNGGPP